MLEEYQKLRGKSDSCLVIKNQTVNNLRWERDNCIREMENLQVAYAKLAEINEMVSNARTEMDLINRELKHLPFGSDTYRFVMEEKADRKDFFRICRKMEELGFSEFYLAGSRMDEEEYTDYRRYFTYDMRISTNQGEEEIEADLSGKQGSAGNGEKQTPYSIILAASLMQRYPKSNSTLWCTGVRDRMIFGCNKEK